MSHSKAIGKNYYLWTRDKTQSGEVSKLLICSHGAQKGRSPLDLRQHRRYFFTARGIVLRAGNDFERKVILANGKLPGLEEDPAGLVGYGESDDYYLQKLQKHLDSDHGLFHFGDKAQYDWIRDALDRPESSDWGIVTIRNRSGSHECTYSELLYLLQESTYLADSYEVYCAFCRSTTHASRVDASKHKKGYAQKFGQKMV